jgi:hypothetical protein
MLRHQQHAIVDLDHNLFEPCAKAGAARAKTVRLMPRLTRTSITATSAHRPQNATSESSGEGSLVATWKPDPTFYPSARLAAQAPPERLAYAALLNVAKSPGPDALGVVDVDPQSPTYAKLIGRVDMPHVGDELHHFGWKACSSALCPYAPHPHIERRYLIVPGLRSSWLYVLDVKENPRAPKLVRTIAPEEVAARTG